MKIMMVMMRKRRRIMIEIEKSQLSNFNIWTCYD